MSSHGIGRQHQSMVSSSRSRPRNDGGRRDYPPRHRSRSPVYSQPQTSHRPFTDQRDVRDRRHYDAPRERDEREERRVRESFQKVREERHHQRRDRRSRSLSNSPPPYRKGMKDENEIGRTLNESSSSSVPRISSQVSTESRPSIIRRIINPDEVRIPRRTGEGSKPIFDREELREAISFRMRENHEENPRVEEQRVVAIIREPIPPTASFSDLTLPLARSQSPPPAPQSSRLDQYRTKGSPPRDSRRRYEESQGRIDDRRSPPRSNSAHLSQQRRHSASPTKETGERRERDLRTTMSRQLDRPTDPFLNRVSSGGFRSRGGFNRGTRRPSFPRGGFSRGSYRGRDRSPGCWKHDMYETGEARDEPKLE